MSELLKIKVIPQFTGSPAVPVEIVEPVASEYVLNFLGVQADDDQSGLDLITVAARTKVENFLARTLITKKYTRYMDAFPGTGQPLPLLSPIDRARFATSAAAFGLFNSQAAIKLPMGPLQSVEEIRYIDNHGNQQTLEPVTDFLVDTASDPGQITPVYSGFWPTARAQVNAVEIDFTGGYGDDGDSVPADIKLAILLTIGHFYENREAQDIPVGAENLLWPYRDMTFQF